MNAKHVCKEALVVRQTEIQNKLEGAMHTYGSMLLSLEKKNARVFSSAFVLKTQLLKHFHFKPVMSLATEA